MTGSYIAQIVSKVERFLFPRTPLDIQPEIVHVQAEQMIDVLEGRRLVARAEPFGGFDSPPGRF